jgi:hypothetical protein
MTKRSRSFIIRASSFVIDSDFWFRHSGFLAEAAHAFQQSTTFISLRTPAPIKIVIDAMTFSGREIARRTSGRTEVRAEPLRCRLPLGQLATADDHLLDVTFTCGLVALDSPVERTMLAETFLSDRTSVTADQAMAHFASPLRDAAARAIGKQPAEHWLADAGRAELADALRAAAKPVAFNCGVELLPPLEVAVESPTLHREKLESMQRKLAERRAAGQVEHVQRAAELLKQFQVLRDAAPGLSPGQILDRVNPADRGTMLETLLLAAGARAGAEQTLWAVAGPNLVRVDARQATPACTIIALPADLGPLRSVQGGDVNGEPRLLVGAQAGVMVIDPARPAEAIRYADRDIASPLGFNSVVATSDTIWATHGEAGVVAWRIGETNSPAFTLRPQPGQTAATETRPVAATIVSGKGSSAGGSGVAGGPRNATVLDEQRILYSAGGSAFAIDRAGHSTALTTAAPSVVFIAVEPDRACVIRADGTIEQLDRRTLQLLGRQQRCGGVTAAGTLPWLGNSRLLLASDDGPVCCVGADDALVTHYASAHRGLRAIAGAADLVAGVSADRQRLVLWKSWDGRQPAAEVHLASLARHRVADISFA